MNLLQQLRDHIALARREHDTYQALARLSDHDLADLGLNRDDLRPLARTAARLGRIDVFAWVRATRSETAEPARAQGRLMNYGFAMRTA